MQLSQNFSLTEFTKSSRAARAGIDNSLPPALIPAAIALAVNVLQPIRDHYQRPVIINSGYRCPEVNRLEGGASFSQHMMAEAADIEIPGIPNAELWEWIRGNLVFDQIIAEYLKKDDGEAGWIHVSFRTSHNRKEARSCIGNGRYVAGLVYA